MTVCYLAEGQGASVYVYFTVALLTLYFMLQNGQTYFKNLAGSHRKIFKVCLTILQHHEIKG